MITKQCLQCGEEIKKPLYRLSIKNWLSRKFCSVECRNTYSVISLNKVEKKKGSDNWKYNKEKHKCIDCGKEREWTNSVRCKDCSTKFLRGENHPNYKDGSSLIKRHYNYDYKLWRMSIFKRDWFTCQYPGCGYNGKDIQAHHIKRVKDNPELINEIDNGITLCVKCHNKTRYKEWFYEKLFSAIINLWK